MQLRKEPYIEQRRHGHKHGPQHQNAAELERGHPEGKPQRGAHAAERQQKRCAAADGMTDKDGSGQHAAQNAARAQHRLHKTKGGITFLQSLYHQHRNPHGEGRDFQQVYSRHGGG